MVIYVFVLFVGVWPAEKIFQAIIDGWIFKMLCAFIDTPIFYGITIFLRKQFNLENAEEISFFNK